MVNDAMMLSAPRFQPDAPQSHIDAADPVPVNRALVTLDRPRGLPGSFLAGFLVVLGVAWLVAVGWGAWSAMAGRQVNAAVVTSWISVAATPLALLLLAGIALRRSPVRERALLAELGQRLRGEASALDAVMMRLSDRADEHRRSVAHQSEQLLQLGGETGQRLVIIGEALRDGTAMLARQAGALDSAADSALRDLGVLVADMPRVRDEVEMLGDAISRAGTLADERAQSLGHATADLAKRAREADTLASGAAHSLAHQVARIGEAAQVAGAHLNEGAATLGAQVREACDTADLSLRAIRSGIDAQGSALVALVEQARAAAVVAGTEGADALTRRIGEVAAALDALGARVAQEDASGRSAFAGLTRQLAELETRQVTLAEASAARTRAMEAAVAAVAGEMERLTGVAGASDLASGAALGRATQLRAELDRCAETMVDGLPVLIEGIEAQLDAVVREADGLAPALTALADGADRSGERVRAAAAVAQAAVNGLEAPLARSEGRLASLGIETEALGHSLAKTASAVDVLAGQAAPQLIEALVRARDAGAQAAERVREALARVVPAGAAAIGDRARAALDEALTEAFEERLDAMSAAAGRAAKASIQAADAVEQRLLALDRAVNEIEARIERGRQAAEEAGDNSFARRMALLIESLNSTAIDVTKILSNEVTDSAWAAYLKGDRGVFTRRAVKLIDAGEAREIGRHYDADTEFRAQVDRYVHDFEAMLRDALAFRGGSPIGITLLSSDVGKLYVALAQAIERLRT